MPPCFFEKRDQYEVNPPKSPKPPEPPENEAEVGRRQGIQTTLPSSCDETSEPIPTYPKSKEEEEVIRSAISNNDFLNKILTGTRLGAIINCMYSRDVAAKEFLIKQGDKGSHMYVSYNGTFQVTIKGKGIVAEFEDVRVFGELAILYNDVRMASVKAVTACKVWVLDRIAYQNITVRSNIEEQNEMLSFLQKSEKLSVIGIEGLKEVANLLKKEFFTSGTKIVKQGDKGDKFYIVRAGSVTVSTHKEGVVGILQKGSCFGELALLKEDCRQATVTANDPGVECLTLTRKEFQEHFGVNGVFEDINSGATYTDRESIIDPEIEYKDVELDDLQFIKTLGVGGFGRVELVQHKKRKDLVFALKYLKKFDIVIQHQQEHVINERIIQLGSKSSLFIVKLFRTYKDSKYVYFLMETCLAGDLFALLQKQKYRRFEDKAAKFLTGCVVEAFDYLHSRNIIYRDLKPENLMIDNEGYIKLTDFGFAKKMPARGKTYTFAGTPEYVAPEIIINKGHNKAVDYWALGVFVFELLAGRTPFRANDRSHMKTFNNILTGIDNVQFPPYFTPKACHIIRKLCRPVPSERLGMKKGAAIDVKEDNWFHGFEWQKLRQRELETPFKPKLAGPLDTSGIEDFKNDRDNPSDEFSGWDAMF